MRITRVRLREVTGTFHYRGEFWEQRLARPLDIYPEHRADPREWWLPEQDGPGPYRLRQIFLEIETDEGVHGLAGPLTRDVALVIGTQLRPRLLGTDPLAIERRWDELYRSQVHGRKGAVMMAISAIDCALWDLRGRWDDAPVHRLLGGPVRTELPVYASTLGFSLELDRATALARQLKAEGFRAQKWFPRWGPADGREGLRRTLALFSALRDAVGEEVELMLDAWMSWDWAYALAAVRELAPLRLYWIEEPFLPDQLEAYAALRARSPIPIAGGEHEYTRWGFLPWLVRGAVDVIQPDIYWAGGISETLKIAVLASTHGIPMIPHGHSVPATVQLLAALPEPVAPWVEYLLKWNELLQFFFREPIKPENGVIHVPERPGMGVELDPAKIDEERELAWDN
jgi:L-alanine-DL-glutamate epimerase-like enolase superfamily enzyme|uniref:Mandelate racemase/muconate lactonizing protein n=1 Tax=Thermomicrobium roseum TaxID=500 RepID=A0A7C1G3H9_THERO